MQIPSNETLQILLQYQQELSLFQKNLTKRYEDVYTLCMKAEIPFITTKFLRMLHNIEEQKKLLERMVTF